MNDLTHFILGAEYASDYTYQPQNGGSEVQTRELNRTLQYAKIKQAYDNAISSGFASLDQFKESTNIGADGIYLDINLETGERSLKSLDTRSTILMNASLVNGNGSERSTTKATIYLPAKEKRWLDKKLDKYAESSADLDKKPLNHTLIDDINDIENSSIKSFFSDKADIPSDQNKKIWYEMWIVHHTDQIIPETYDKINRLGIKISEYHIVFKHTVVFLIQANRHDLEKLPSAINYLSDIRLSKQPSILRNGDPVERQEWVHLLESIINTPNGKKGPIIGIIDTGINNAHPLIQQFLPSERTECIISGHEHVDNDSHGTGMGGLCLYGDLTDLCYQRGEINISHRLASVKIFSQKFNYPNQQYLYGVLTENAVERLEEMGASIFCLALSEDDEECSGEASSWSADIDKILYHGGECDRLMFIAAGNIDNLEGLTQETYQGNCLEHKIQSPAQSLNAITVGAYTEKVVDLEHGKTGNVLAPPKAISPYSRTSYKWKSSRIKPDIVMEGGNVLMDRLWGARYPDDLSLITTSADLRESFQSFNATSAATALATRLAAQIKSLYPELSSLAIRGLIVHSAQWTDEMKNVEAKKALSMYGYGVPSSRLALNSNDKYATYIFEKTIVPFKEGKNGKAAYSEFHLYTLPWPSELLMSMGEENVKIKITLSYYVDPSPGERNRLNKYRYHNASLNFDLKRPSETTEAFIARHNKVEDRYQHSSSDTTKWNIGIRNRQRGSVQSDWIECTAAELADRDQIMIYPGSGWWKEQKIRNIENSIKYALIVSIETSKTSIYNEISQIIANKTPIGLTI